MSEETKYTREEKIDDFMCSESMQIVLLMKKLIKKFEKQQGIFEDMPHRQLFIKKMYEHMVIEGICLQSEYFLPQNLALEKKNIIESMTVVINDVFYIFQENYEYNSKTPIKGETK